jgi:hypothetical protein
MNVDETIKNALQTGTKGLVVKDDEIESLPQEITQLKMLETLEVHCANLAALFPEILELTNLTSLYIYLEEHQVYFGSLPSLFRPSKVSSVWISLLM